jgi:hypothetical protein
VQEGYREILRIKIKKEIQLLTFLNLGCSNYSDFVMSGRSNVKGNVIMEANYDVRKKKANWNTVDYTCFLYLSSE